MTKSRVPPEKRVRVAQACARCKRRKEKCDGQTPCRNCTKAGVLCMTTTQAQLSGTVGDVRTSEPPIKRQRTVSVEHDPFSGILRDGLGFTPYDIQTDMKMQLSPGLPSPISPISEGRVSYGSPKSSTSRSTPVRKTPTKTCPHARTTTEQMANCLRDILLEREGSQSTATRACCRKICSGSHADRPEIRMPTYDEMTNLLSVFRTHVASILDPCLDNHFVDLVKMPSFANHPTNRHILSELILAVAYQCVASSTLSVKRRFSAVTTEAALARASAHFRTAQIGFDMANSMENPDISAVEVLLLMGVYRFLEGGEVAAASLLGLAISMAQTLGLNEMDYQSGNQSPDDVPAGVWNSLYNFDRVLALSTSRTCLIPQDALPLSPESASSKISIILGKILQATRSPESTPEVLQPLSNELKSFITTLPVEYRWSTILSDSNRMPQPDLIKSLHVNALYFCAIFRLTKVSLLETTKRANRGSSGKVDEFSFSFMDSMNYNNLNATYESRWSEAGLYSAQTSLRLFEKAKQCGISIHGTPLFETWLTLSFLISISGIFTFPSSTSLKASGSTSPGTPTDVESRLSQLSQLYQGLISNARMSPRLCSLSTFINDLRGYLSRKSEDVTCGKDSFEALFGSMQGDASAITTEAVIIDFAKTAAANGALNAILDDSVLTPINSERGIDCDSLTIASSESKDLEDSMAVFLPETPSSIATGKMDIDVKEECNIEILSGEPKIASDVDDLWQKIFEDLDPQDIEPDANLKKLGLSEKRYDLENNEEITALERLIGRSEGFA